MLHFLTHGGDIHTPAEVAIAVLGWLLVAVALGLAVKTNTLSDRRVSRHKIPLALFVAAVVAERASVPIAETLIAASALMSIAVLLTSRYRRRRTESPKTPML